MRKIILKERTTEKDNNLFDELDCRKMNSLSGTKLSASDLSCNCIIAKEAQAPKPERDQGFSA